MYIDNLARESNAYTQEETRQYLHIILTSNYEITLRILETFFEY